jgi:hypothetical protein
VLQLRLTCLPVKKRFPIHDHLVEAGILEEKEKEVIAGTEGLCAGLPDFSCYIHT